MTTPAIHPGIRGKQDKLPQPTTPTQQIQKADKSLRDQLKEKTGEQQVADIDDFFDDMGVLKEAFLRGMDDALSQLQVEEPGVDEELVRAAVKHGFEDRIKASARPSAGMTSKERSNVVKNKIQGDKGDFGHKGKGSFKKQVDAIRRKGGVSDPEAVAAASHWKAEAKKHSSSVRSWSMTGSDKKPRISAPKQSGTFKQPDVKKVAETLPEMLEKRGINVNKAWLRQLLAGAGAVGAGTAAIATGSAPLAALGLGPMAALKLEQIAGRNATKALLSKQRSETVRRLESMMGNVGTNYKQQLSEYAKSTETGKLRDQARSLLKKVTGD